jgi:flagellar biosynthesis protein FliQ
VSPLQVARDGLVLALVVASPALLAALAVALVVGALQAATQIHESTISFVPKLAAVFVALLLGGPWMGAALIRFCERVFLAIR